MTAMTIETQALSDTPIVDFGTRSVTFALSRPGFSMMATSATSATLEVGTPTCRQRAKNWLIAQKGEVDKL